MVGSRPARDRRLELRRAARCSTGCCCREDSELRQRRAPGEPAVRRAVDHAPDAARLAARRGAATTSRATAPDVAMFESGTVYRAGGATLRARRRTPRTRRAAERVARRRAPGAASRARPTSSRPRRCWRRCSRSLRVQWSVAQAQLAVPAPRAQRRGARSRRGLRADRSASSASCTRSSPARWDLATGSAPALRDRSRQARRRAPEAIAFQPFAAVPPLRQDLAVTLPEDGLRRRRSCHAVREAGGEMLDERRACSTSTRAAGRRGPALAGARAVLPRARAHAHRRGRRAGARADRRGARRSSAVSCVADGAHSRGAAPGAPSSPPTARRA